MEEENAGFPIDVPTPLTPLNQLRAPSIKLLGVKNHKIKQKFKKSGKSSSIFNNDLPSAINKNAQESLLFVGTLSDLMHTDMKRKLQFKHFKRRGEGIMVIKTLKSTETKEKTLKIFSHLKNY